ncbi:MAG: FecR domain-containing protein [Kiloniellales bacterium]|nr:FecR domain-containing protein [Kiloniellales bacterium]
MTLSVPRDKDLTEAARWYARIKSEETVQADQQRFRAWLEADPRHHSAFLEVVSVAADVSELPHLKNIEQPGERVGTPRGVWRAGSAWWHDVRQSGRVITAAVLTAALSLLVVGALALLPSFSDAPTHYETAVGEIRTVELPDRSTVTLGPRSRFELDFSNGARRVVLVNGEAFFGVAKDRLRPFLVVVGDTQIRVVGTTFNVHHGLKGVTVAVAAGTVEVAKPTFDAHPKAVTASETPRRLEAGQKAVVTHSGEIGAVEEISPDRPGAWISGRLYYEDNPLGEVVADANRYSSTPIVIASAELAELPVYASFSTNSVDEMLTGLERMLPVTVDRRVPGRIVLRARRN